MTITIGSKWINKRQASMFAVVVATLKWNGDKYIIYETKTTNIDPRWAGDMRIKSATMFLRDYRHPEPVGDVP